MGKKKDRKRDRKKAKRLTQRLAEHLQSIFASPDIQDRFKAIKSQLEERAKDKIAGGFLPERCPCGKSWDKCPRREEFLGTHH